MKRLYTNLYVLLFLCVYSDAVLSQGIDSFIANQVQSQISRQISAGISKNLNENLLIPLLTVRNKSGEVKDLAVSHDQRFYSVIHQDGTVRVWDAVQGVQRPVINADGRSFLKTASRSANSMVFIGAGDGKIYVYDILTGKAVTELDAGIALPVTALALSATDSKLAVAYKDGKIVIWDLQNFKQTAAWSGKAQTEYSQLAFNQHETAVFLVSTEGGIDIWDMQKPKKLTALPALPGKKLGLWLGPDLDLVMMDTDTNLQWLEPPGNQLKLQKKISNTNSGLAADVDFNHKLLVMAASDNKVQLLNLNDLSLIKDLTGSQAMHFLHFINQGKHVIGADDSGVLHIWDVSSADEVLQLISTTGGWSAVDNVGRYDSSERALTNISWQAGSKDIPIDNTSGNYYEPDLLATLLNSDAYINKSPQKIKEGINLPPEVNLTVPASGVAGEEIQIGFEIIDAGGGIGEQRLYQNGKIVDPVLMTASNDSEVDGITHRNVSYKIVLNSGINKFRVVATNKMGIESLVQQQDLKASGDGKQPNLYVMVIGINKYKDPSLNLSYSVQDAQSIVTTLGNKNTAAFNNISANNLLDQSATRDAIVNQLNAIAESSKSNDVLIVYFAGHGIAVKGEWYFLPHETVFHSDEQYYVDVGLSAKQIQALIAKIPAEKILVMFDSCYSGSGIKVFEELNKTQRHISRSLSKNDGIVVLAATRKDQEAMELAELGHGLFTYIVQKGMHGAADLQPIDKNISAHEVVNYVTDTIPSFTHKYANASQEPTSFTIGDDFMLLGF